ncbi:MAG: hypothetical protein K2H91_09905 [Lachnospiraceae bacterium]|nr:hypothetical protein [Lachnospiraceae bacterium]
MIRAKNQGVTEYLEQVIITDIQKVYGDLFWVQETSLVSALMQIYAETDKGFIYRDIGSISEFFELSS